MFVSSSKTKLSQVKPSQIKPVFTPILFSYHNKKQNHHTHTDKQETNHLKKKIGEYLHPPLQDSKVYCGERPPQEETQGNYYTTIIVRHYH
mmetsp:Transcript_482/g.727  ORF Transcript_482/g.727 Transcript_482/m.727 type:complete len:91 (+) Transcript_482:148-420(+)